MIAPSATKIFAITKSDSTVYFPAFRALYVGGPGDVALLAKGDTVAVTLVAVQAGTLLPISGKQVLSTGTTATNLVGFR